MPASQSIYTIDDSMQSYQHWELNNLNYSLSSAKDLRSTLNDEIESAGDAGHLVSGALELLKRNMAVLKKNLKAAQETTYILSNQGLRIKITNAKWTQADLNYCSSATVLLKRLKEKKVAKFRRQEGDAGIHNELLSKNNTKAAGLRIARRRSYSSDSTSHATTKSKKQQQNNATVLTKPNNIFANKLKGFVRRPVASGAAGFGTTKHQNCFQGTRKRRRVIPFDDSSDNETDKEGSKAKRSRKTNDSDTESPGLQEISLEPKDSKIEAENHDMLQNAESPKSSTCISPLSSAKNPPQNARNEMQMTPNKEIQRDLSNETTLPLESSTLVSLDEEDSFSQESDEDIIYATSDDDVEANSTAI